MKKTNLLLLAAALCLALAAPAMAKPGMTAPGKEAPLTAQQKFEKMDTNKDGAVSWDEFKTFYPQMQKKAFEAIDTNKDGAISLDEWLKFVGQHQKDMRQEQGGTMPNVIPPKGGEAHPGNSPVLITPPSK